MSLRPNGRVPVGDRLGLKKKKKKSKSSGIGDWVTEGIFLYFVMVAWGTWLEWVSIEAVQKAQ